MFAKADVTGPSVHRGGKRVISCKISCKIDLFFLTELISLIFRPEAIEDERFFARVLELQINS